VSNEKQVQILKIGEDKVEALEQQKLKDVQLKIDASDAIKSILSNTDITFEEFTQAVKDDKDLATTLLYNCMLLLRRMNPDLVNDTQK
jgi:cytidylate kinase